jgi:hypothetical protein
MRAGATFVKPTSVIVDREYSAGCGNAVLRTFAARHAVGIRSGEFASLVDAVERVRLSPEEREALLDRPIEAGHRAGNGDTFVLTERAAAALPKLSQATVAPNAGVIKVPDGMTVVVRRRSA